MIYICRFNRASVPNSIPNILSDVLLANFSNGAVYAFHGYMPAPADQAHEGLILAGLEEVPSWTFQLAKQNWLILVCNGVL